MKTVKIKQKNTEKKDVAGIIIGLMFFAMLAAVVYFVADSLIISREITPENISKDWHYTKNVGEDETTHWTFSPDGYATTYKMNNNTKIKSDEVRYTYTIDPPEEGKTHPVIHVTPDDRKLTKAEREAGRFGIRVTRVTKAEMDVEFIYDRFTTETTRLTTKLF